MIDEVMDNFDFDKVLKAMVALKWEWAKGGYDYDKPSREQMYSPAIGDLRRSARRLLRKVIREGSCAIASGGFHVTWQNGNLALMFVVSEWDENDSNTQEGE